MSAGPAAERRLELERIEPEAVVGPLPEGLADTGLPVPPGYRLPPNYRVTRRGVEVLVQAKRGDYWQIVCPVPLVVTGYVRLDVLYVRVDWLRGNRKESILQPASTIADARRLVGLADHGLLVNSNNARDVVTYLTALQDANEYALPEANGTTNLGWQADGSFLLGRLLVTEAGTEIDCQDIDRIAPADWLPGQIIFRGEGQGEEQAVGGYRQAGSLQGWLDTIQCLTKHPRAMLCLYASLSAPLLDILNAPGYAVDQSGITSTGKTTNLRAALSVWGSIDEHDPGSLLGSWDTTTVAVERALALRRGIPLGMDDTTRNRKPEILVKVLYDQSAGRGRARGALQGSRAVSVHRTVLLTTGEAPLTSYSVAGGQHARALCLTGPPLPANSEDMVAKVCAGLLAHYGVAGVVWVRWLLQHRDDWPRWRDRYTQLRAERAKGVSAVQGRIGAYTATITLTAELAQHALGLDGRDPVPDLADELAHGAGQADLARAAMDTILSYCRANPDAFWRRELNEMRQPPNGWWGSWDLAHDLATGRTTWRELALYQHQAQRLLTQAGHDPATILRVWADRGWIETESDGRTAPKKRICGQRSRCVVILPAADADADAAQDLPSFDELAAA